jgi:hypothetical protein
LENDELTYRKYRRFLTIDCYYFPSTDDLLDNFADLLSESASHYLWDFDSLDLTEKIRLAYSELNRISWCFGEQPKVRRNVKSMELSKDLLLSLAQHNPYLLMKVVRTSQLRLTATMVQHEPGKAALALLND